MHETVFAGISDFAFSARAMTCKSSSNLLVLLKCIEDHLLQKNLPYLHTSLPTQLFHQPQTHCSRMFQEVLFSLDHKSLAQMLDMSKLSPSQFSFQSVPNERSSTTSVEYPKSSMSERAIQDLAHLKYVH